MPILYERVETGEVIDKRPDGQQLTAVYDVVAAESIDGFSLSVSNRITVIDVRIDDLGFTPASRDFVTVKGQRFMVTKRIPSSSGMMKLQLGER